MNASIEELQERYEAGVMLRSGVTATYDARRAEVVLVSERAWRLRTTDPALHGRALGLLGAGTTPRALEELLGASRAARLLRVLDEQGLLRDAYVNHFAGTAQERQIEYFADRIADPNEAQRAL